MRLTTDSENVFICEMCVMCKAGTCSLHETGAELGSFWGIDIKVTSS